MYQCVQPVSHGRPSLSHMSLILTNDVPVGATCQPWLTLSPPLDWVAQAGRYGRVAGATSMMRWFGQPLALGGFLWRSWGHSLGREGGRACLQCMEGGGNCQAAAPLSPDARRPCENISHTEDVPNMCQ